MLNITADINMTDFLKIEKYLKIILYYLLVCVFIVSGLTKLIDIKGFEIAVSRFEILPSFFISYFSILLPVVELFLGLCLLFGLYINLVLKSLFILTCFFILVIITTLIRGITVNCGCFGGLFNDIVGTEVLIRNIFLLGLLTFLIKN